MQNNITDFMKTILIYILAVSMLVFAGVYINARQNAGQKDEIPWEKQIIFSGGDIYTTTDANQVNPVQITVTYGGSSRTAVYNDNLIARIYDIEFIKFAINGLFNKSANCMMLDKIEGGELWRKCAENENSVYIKYAGDYIYPIIHAFLNEASDGAATSKDIVKIRELFIVNEDPFFGVARDSEGNVAAFTPSGEDRYISVQINASLRSAYNNIEGGFPCRFSKNNMISGETGINKNNIKNLSFIESFHLFENYTNILHNSSVLTFENPLLNQAGDIDLQKESIKNLFKLFDFNQEGANFSASSMTYTDGPTSVRFAGSKQIMYTHRPNNNINTNSLHLSRFLGYDADYYTFYEKVKAASAFANELRKNFAELVGGPETSLYLKEIIADNHDLIIIFAYYHKGTEVKIKDTDGAVILTINKDGISEAVINVVSISSLNQIKNINPMLILSEADRLISEDIEKAGDDESLYDELMKKYNLSYDKNQGKFLVNQLELIYNIDYAASERKCEPVWVIK